MKLGLKIILPILLLTFIILGSFGYLFYNLKQQEIVISAQGAKVQKLNSLNERLNRQQDITVYNVLAYRFSQDKASLLAISQTELDKSKTLDEMFPFITSSKGRELVNNYIDTRKEVESLRNELIRVIDEGDKDHINLQYNKWSIQTQNIKAALADIGAYNINSLEKTLALVNAISNEITQVIIILAFVVIAIVLFLYFYLRIVITTPIVKLAQFADEISRQNFTTTTTTTTTTTRKDELGMLSRAFNTMVIKLKESYSTLEQKVSDRTKDLENANIAAQNVLEDLQVEKVKLVETKAKDEAMLASIGDGVIATDAEGKSIIINKSAEDILGFTDTEIIGKSFIHSVSQEDAQGNKIPDRLRPITLALDSGKATIATTYQFVRKDGSKVPVAITVTPVIIDAKTIGAMLVFRDITKEREVDKAKTEFVSLASHQLRTPLGIMKWYLEVWEKEDFLKKAPEKIKMYFNEVYKNNERVLSIVRDLLSVSRIDQGRVKDTPTLVNISEFLTNIVKEMQIVARRKNIKLSLNITKKNILQYPIDSMRLRQVIENLITNALEYTKADGRVDVGLDTKDESLLLIVKDTGIGISAKDQKKIFSKFFRSDKAIGHNPEGSGLGLYVVKSYVEGWGGKISVESVEGKGSIFTVSLPMKEVIKN